jgi:hypothetical protein
MGVRDLLFALALVRVAGIYLERCRGRRAALLGGDERISQRPSRSPRPFSRTWFAISRLSARNLTLHFPQPRL